MSVASAIVAMGLAALALFKVSAVDSAAFCEASAAFCEVSAAFCEVSDATVTVFSTVSLDVSF
jgi:hypothetical protein